MTESTLRGYRRIGWLGGLVVTAVLVRVLYVSTYVTTLPFAYGPMGDSLVYLQQANDVRAGNLGSPSLIAFSPLYGYALALITRGPSLWPILAQLALGVLNIALAYRLTRTLFGQFAGIVTGILMLGHATFLFLESKILSETLAITLLLLGFHVYFSRGFREGKVVAAMGAGAVLALAVLARASMLFTIPFFVLCALMPWASQDVTPSLRLRRSILCAVGALSIFGANGMVNLHYSGVFVPVIMVSRTLETASKVSWTGSFDAFSHDGRQASPFDVVEQAAVRLRGGASQEPSLLTRLQSIDVGTVIRGVPTKWGSTFSNRESFQEYGFLGERSVIPILRYLPVSFGGIAILSLFGCWALWREQRLREIWPLLPAILGTLVTTALYHPSSRYRLAMVIPLLVLAGWGVAYVVRLPRSRIQQVAGSVMLVALAITTTHLMTMGPGNRPAWHLELGISAYSAGEYDAAAREAQMAAQMAPAGSPTQRRAVLLLQQLQSRARRPKQPANVID